MSSKPPPMAASHPSKRARDPYRFVDDARCGVSHRIALPLTKGAITGFTRSLVRDLGPKGITVNTGHPGPTDTDMLPDGGPVGQIVGPGIAVGRYGQPHEIAGVVAFLASPDAAFVTGAEIVADGGFTA
ncbi:MULTISPECIES: SDR family oxidoreductase [Cupriavidus]|nr:MULTISPECIES: SDR family oxidoreductase [Cupriavidus]